MGFCSFRELQVNMTGIVCRSGSISRNNLGKWAGNRTCICLWTTLGRIKHLEAPWLWRYVCVVSTVNTAPSKRIGSGSMFCAMCDSEPLAFKKSSSFYHFAFYKYHSDSIMEDGLGGKESKGRKPVIGWLWWSKWMMIKANVKPKIDMSNKVWEKEGLVGNVDFVEEMIHFGIALSLKWNIKAEVTRGQWFWMWARIPGWWI